MTKYLFLFVFTICLIPGVQAAGKYPEETRFEYISLAENLLYNVRTGENYKLMQDALEKAPEAELLKQLNTDSKRKAFWLNIYNAFIQIKLKNAPGQYKDRNSFFSSDLLLVAGQKLSFDDIENGILRHSKIKISMGYLGKIIVGDFERKFRVDTLDFRIHFALNCGAKSCPPIAYYSVQNIDRQLDLAAQTYLGVECRKDQGAIWVPKIMSWFGGDFGGKQGITQILKKYKVIAQDASPEIKFLDYNWTMTLGAYED